MHVRSVITNLKYVSAANHGDFMGQLKYMQYRDGKQEHIVQTNEEGNPLRRFINRGLGDGYKPVHRQCSELQTTTMQDPDKNITARLLMVGPEPELMHTIPEDRRLDVLEEYTDAVVNKWFEKMETPGQPEYSFVMHEANTSDQIPPEERGELAHDKSYFHSHVVIAATTQGIEGREHYWVGKEEIKLLHEAGREEMERIWTRELGPEKVEELNQYLEDRTEQLQQADREKGLDLFKSILPENPSLGVNLESEIDLDNKNDDLNIANDVLDITDDDDGIGLELGL